MRAHAYSRSEAGTDLRADPGLHVKPDLESRLGSDTNAGAHSTGGPDERQPGSLTDETRLHAQPGLADKPGVDPTRQPGVDTTSQTQARVRCDQTCVRRDNAGVVGDQPGVPDDGPGVVRDEAGHDRIRRRDREAMLVGYGLLQRTDRVVRGDGNAGDSAGNR